MKIYNTDFNATCSLMIFSFSYKSFTCIKQCKTTFLIFQPKCVIYLSFILEKEDNLFMAQWPEGNTG